MEIQVIEMDDDLPIKEKYYPISPVVQKFMYEELDRILSIGVIEPSKSLGIIE